LIRFIRHKKALPDTKQGFFLNNTLNTVKESHRDFVAGRASVTVVLVLFLAQHEPSIANFCLANQFLLGSLLIFSGGFVALADGGSTQRNQTGRGMTSAFFVTSSVWMWAICFCARERN
jgi:hypothetical protein